jgi:hypothetical protein
MPDNLPPGAPARAARLTEDDLKRAEDYGAAAGLVSAQTREWIAALVAECRARAIEGTGEVTDIERKLEHAYARIGELDWALRKHGVNPTTITTEQPAGRRYPQGSGHPDTEVPKLSAAPDAEIAAMATVLAALRPLDALGQDATLGWVGRRLERDRQNKR